MTARRTNQANGFVAFPISDPTYPSTKEGGMFVQLVVVDPAEDWDARWPVCCGAETIVTTYTESYLGDDKRPIPQDYDERQGYEEFHFPRLNDSGKVDDVINRFQSIPYLAAITMGSTGWSGYHEDKGYWRCTYDHLTADGKQLYDLIQRLYPGCELYLQTWLDT